MIRGIRNAGATCVLLNVLCMASMPAAGVALFGSQVGAGTWSYDLTFAPLDNYSIPQFGQLSTTITLSGLAGVTAATGPQSTDFSGSLNSTNLNWIAEVLNGGTAVRWTHVGPGTGNFSVDKHAYGFEIFAAGAVEGVANYVTDGFSRDVTNPLADHSFDLDVSGTVAGPVVAPATAPLPLPGSLWLMLGGFAALFATRRASTSRARGSVIQ